MSILDALFLGIVQGLTEFLPVSSSGHLELVKAIQGQTLSGEDSLFMTVILHAATASSTVIVFWKDILEIFKGLVQFKNNEAFRFSLKIILSMIPAAMVGVFLDDWIEGFFGGNIAFVGFMLLLTGILLFVADKAKTTEKGVGFPQALIIGISQAIAILPGISRSGSTIATSVLLGIDREKSARFSFLMVVPLIFGKMAKDLLSDEFSRGDIGMGAIAIGFIAALATGIVACKWMISLVKKSKLRTFAIYCFIVGIVAVAISLC